MFFLRDPRHCAVQTPTASFDDFLVKKKTAPPCRARFACPVSFLHKPQIVRVHKYVCLFCTHRDTTATPTFLISFSVEKKERRDRFCILFSVFLICIVFFACVYDLRYLRMYSCAFLQCIALLARAYDLCHLRLYLCVFDLYCVIDMCRVICARV